MPEYVTNGVRGTALRHHGHKNGVVMRTRIEEDARAAGDRGRDWEASKRENKDFSDDGTMTFFW